MNAIDEHLQSAAGAGGNQSCSSIQLQDPCAQVVHILMCYQVGGGDPEFVRKAIESLVKKLKDRREQLDALISAVTSAGKQPTSCVTIHRSLDGRLQVAGRKGLPHVVYARIWRWPNVNKTELLKLALCLTPTDHPDLICINPFHYDRIVSSGLANMEMSSLRMDPLNAIDNTLPLQPVPNSLPDMNEFGPSTSSQRASMSHFLVADSRIQQPTIQNSSTPAASAPANNDPTLHQRWSSPPDNFSCSPRQVPSVITANNEEHFLHPVNYNLIQIHLPTTQSPPEHWCSITYFELDTQLGETFKAPWTMAEVLIDGGMDPAGARTGRFCLGALPNVHRSEASEKARLHIGKGVRLSCASDGNVYLKCLSQKGVFVRSYYLDYEHELPYGSTVHKFCSGVERKLFDLRWAYAEMCGQRESAQLAAVAQAYAMSGFAPELSPSLAERAGTGVDDLRRVCCTVSISFVKGWGAGYSRWAIKQCPVWVEIQLHRPLQLLNELLQHND